MGQFDELIQIRRSDAESILSALNAYCDLKTYDFDDVEAALQGIRDSRALMRGILDHD